MSHSRLLPSRYDVPWGSDFWALVDAQLRPGVTVLDVGGGRRPTIDPTRRPAGTRYWGLDADANELALAPEGSYEKSLGASAEEIVPELEGQCDLIVSWQVLEHVHDQRRVAEAFRAHAAPGGIVVAMLSGRNAAYAVANRLLPARLAGLAVARLRERPVDTVFRTRYDRCTYDGLLDAFSVFDEVRVTPHWHAADYFDRLGTLQRLYLGYENWAARGDRRALATNYVLFCRRAG